jgi:PAS domain S-box-containing protein
MSATDFLSLLTQSIFVLLAAITGVDFLRHGDRIRGDSALMFLSLAIVILVGWFTDISGMEVIWLTVVGRVAFVAQPYLTLRLAQHFHAAPLWIRRFALAGLIVSALAIIIFASVLPTPIALVIIVYFILIDGYAMLFFIRGAFRTAGVIRIRLRFAAAGSGLLAGALAALVVQAAIPTLADVIGLLTQVIVILSALAYYFSFAPPGWLRRAWQLGELYKYLHLSSANINVGQNNVDEKLDQLCSFAHRAVGGSNSIAALWSEPDQQLQLRHMNDTLSQSGAVISSDSLIGQAWDKRSLATISRSDALTHFDCQLLDTMGSESALITPIATSEHAWGLLLVFLKHGSLFVDHDLSMIALLSTQCAIMLENDRLVDALRGHAMQLEEKVEERTTALQESEERYRRIIETTQEGIWTKDADNKTSFVNRRMADMLGYTVEELLTIEPATFIAENGTDVAVEHNERRRQGIREQYELKFRRKDSSELWGLVSATPFLDTAGKHVGALAMVMDITERKQAEQALMALNMELEQRVSERTAQLMVVNKELETFSYSVSHDLRAPLRATDGYSQALLQDYADKLDDEGKRYLQRIRDASQRMGQLIDDLLKLSQITRHEFERQQVDLSALVRGIADELQARQPERKVEWIITDGLVVDADRRLLQVALTNLLSNAWKFTSKRPTSQIEFGRTEQSGEIVYFVRDTGAGFDMAYANKLFGAFQRLHGVNEFEGTGIGLATVQRVISRHGGRIWAEGHVDVGATFYFTI